MLDIINFVRGALYMMGAFVAYFMLEYAGLSYWWAIEPAARRKGPRNAG
jgi:branched-chain amino acid transport system permease protein